MDKDASDLALTNHAILLERFVRTEAGLAFLNGSVLELKGQISIMTNRISDLEKWVWRVTGFLSAGMLILNFVNSIASSYFHR